MTCFSLNMGITFRRIIFILLLFTPHISFSLSDLRLCADSNCQKLISEGRTLVNYPAAEPGMLSFRPDEEVKIFSKSAGSKSHLWGVEINGVRGYANKLHIRESKIHVSNPTVIAPVSSSETLSRNEIPVSVVGKESEFDRIQSSLSLTENPTHNSEFSQFVFEGTTFHQELASKALPESFQASDFDSKESRGVDSNDKLSTNQDSSLFSNSKAEQSEMHSVVQSSMTDYSQPSIPSSFANNQLTESSFEQSIQYSHPAIVISSMENQPSVSSSQIENLTGSSIGQSHLSEVTVNNSPEQEVTQSSIVQSISAEPFIGQSSLENLPDVSIGQLAPSLKEYTQTLLVENLTGSSIVQSSTVDETQTSIVQSSAEDKNSPELAQPFIVQSSTVDVIQTSIIQPLVDELTQTSILQSSTVDVTQTFIQSPAENEISQTVGQSFLESLMQSSRVEDLAQPFISLSSTVDSTQTSINSFSNIHSSDSSNSQFSNDGGRDFSDDESFMSSIGTSSMEQLTQMDSSVENEWTPSIHDLPKDDSSQSFIDPETPFSKKELTESIDNYIYDYDDLPLTEENSSFSFSSTLELDSETPESTTEEEMTLDEDSEQYDPSPLFHSKELESESSFEKNALENEETFEDTETLSISSSKEEFKTDYDLFYRFQILSVLWCVSIVTMYFSRILLVNSSIEKALKRKIAELDKKLFESTQENFLLKKNEPDTEDSFTTDQTYALELLKEENESLKKETGILAEIISEKNRLEEAYESLKNEHAETEKMVHDYFEERKTALIHNSSFIETIQQLQEQFDKQKHALSSYEARIKKRDTELKEKIQESRKLKADLGNAKLKMDKSLQRIEELETSQSSYLIELSKIGEMTQEMSTLHQRIKDSQRILEERDSELEKQRSEIEILNTTLSLFKKSVGKQGDGEEENGWDTEETATFPDFEELQEIARIKVDYSKATSALESLSSQLLETEILKDNLNSQVEELNVELEVSRRARDEALKEKNELSQKHSVLNSYFNQRENELQKQLGLCMARLGDVEKLSSSSSKSNMSLLEELESKNNQLSLLKLELEEQDRSWKASNSTLEKKQHESWLVVRQETRKNLEAQNENRALRSKLTLSESKLLEKDVEITRLKEENNGLQESLVSISSRVLSSGPSLPPDLPPLPLLPPSPPPPLLFMYSDSRPPPLGRRSPPHGALKTSSPPLYTSSHRSFRHKGTRDSSPDSERSFVTDERNRSTYRSYRNMKRGTSSQEKSPERISSSDKKKKNIGSKMEGPKTSSPMI